MSDATNKIRKTSFETLQKLLPVTIRCNQVPFLAGQPGIGKSAVLKNLANQFNTKMFVLSVNQLGTREDLTGARSMLDESTNTYRQVFFPHAVIQDCIDYAKAHPSETPFLFLDEINRTGVDVTSAVMALITERRIGTTELPENIRIIAAGNDAGNINVMDEASFSRMSIYHVEADIDSFINAQPNLNFYIKELLRKSPALLVQTDEVQEIDEDGDDDDDDESTSMDFEDIDENSMNQITVPRTLTHLSDILNALELDGNHVPDNIIDYINPFNQDESTLQNLIVATIGNTDTAVQLLDNISSSIENLQKTATLPTNQIDLPTPNADLMTEIYQNGTTDDEVQAIFNSGKYTQDDFLNTFFTLAQTQNLAKLKSVTALEQYYIQLVETTDWNDDRKSTINKLFAKMLQAKELPTQLIDTIQLQDDDVSGQLKFIIQTLS